MNTYDKFNITLAGEVVLTIHRRRDSNDECFFDIYIEDKKHGSIYPDHGFGPEPPLVWRTYDKFDPYLVNLIGLMIEDYDA